MRAVVYFLDRKRNGCRSRSAAILRYWPIRHSRAQGSTASASPGANPCAFEWRSIGHFGGRSEELLKHFGNVDPDADAIEIPILLLVWQHEHVGRGDTCCRARGIRGACSRTADDRNRS